MCFISNHSSVILIGLSHRLHEKIYNLSDSYVYGTSKRYGSVVPQYWGWLIIDLRNLRICIQTMIWSKNPEFHVLSETKTEMLPTMYPVITEILWKYFLNHENTNAEAQTTHKLDSSEIRIINLYTKR